MAISPQDRVHIEASSPQALLDALSARIVPHAPRFSLQLSCSARHYPRLFCLIRLNSGHPLAVASALGGQVSGAASVVAFVDVSATFFCAKRAHGAPDTDCYDCRREQ